MGFLSVKGDPLFWKDCIKVTDKIKKYGVIQFLNVYNYNKDREDSINELKWGDELEFIMVKLDDKKKRSVPFLSAEKVIERPDAPWTSSPDEEVEDVLKFKLQPEYARYMLEVVPEVPYSASLNSVLDIERSMRNRRQSIKRYLPDGVELVSVTSYPDFDEKVLDADPMENLDESVSKSIFVTNEVTYPHPRFFFLTRNIRERRGAKVHLMIPLYKDSRTRSCLSSLTDTYLEPDSTHNIDRFQLQKLSYMHRNPVKDHIYMDAMIYGMGMCCIQYTYLSPNVDTARYLYDQLLVLAPLWLALTASTPFLRGLVADTDTRWESISASVDCRTAEEMLSLPKSRYSAASLYIANSEFLKKNYEDYNNTKVPINREVYNELLSNGIDSILAKHIAHMFVRDPLVVFEDAIEVDHSLSTNHFENFQSTNWNTVRFKPPPPSSDGGSPSDIGWRVEFRTPEMQFTDFENTAFTSLLLVLVRVLLSKRLSFYLPMSCNDENMKRSSYRNAIQTQKFFFPTRLDESKSPSDYNERSIYDIFFPSDSSSFSIFEICLNYLYDEYLLSNNLRTSAKEVSPTGLQASSSSNLETGSFRLEPLSPSAILMYLKYFLFIGARIAGKLQTNATFMRRLLDGYPHYLKNSIIPSSFVYDFFIVAKDLGYGFDGFFVDEIYGYLDVVDKDTPCATPTNKKPFINASPIEGKIESPFQTASWTEGQSQRGDRQGTSSSAGGNEEQSPAGDRKGTSSFSAEDMQKCDGKFLHFSASSQSCASGFSNPTGNIVDPSAASRPGFSDSMGYDADSTFSQKTEAYGSRFSRNYDVFKQKYQEIFGSYSTASSMASIDEGKESFISSKLNVNSLLELIEAIEDHPAYPPSIITERKSLNGYPCFGGKMVSQMMQTFECSPCTDSDPDDLTSSMNAYADSSNTENHASLKFLDTSGSFSTVSSSISLLKADSNDSAGVSAFGVTPNGSGGSLATVGADVCINSPSSNNFHIETSKNHPRNWRSCHDTNATSSGSSGDIHSSFEAAAVSCSVKRPGNSVDTRSFDSKAHGKQEGAGRDFPAADGMAIASSNEHPTHMANLAPAESFFVKGLEINSDEDIDDEVISFGEGCTRCKYEVVNEDVTEIWMRKQVPPRCFVVPVTRLCGREAKHDEMFASRLGFTSEQDWEYSRKIIELSS